MAQLEEILVRRLSLEEIMPLTKSGEAEGLNKALTGNNDAFYELVRRKLWDQQGKPVLVVFDETHHSYTEPGCFGGGYSARQDEEFFLGILSGELQTKTIQNEEFFLSTLELQAKKQMTIPINPHIWGRIGMSVMRLREEPLVIGGVPNYFTQAIDPSGGLRPDILREWGRNRHDGGCIENDYSTESYTFIFVGDEIAAYFTTKKAAEKTYADALELLKTAPAAIER